MRRQYQTASQFGQLRADRYSPGGASHAQVRHQRRSCAAGLLMMGLYVARHFGRFHGGLL